MFLGKQCPWYRTAALILPVLASSCADEPESRFSRTRLGDTILVHSWEPRIADTLVPRETARVGLADGPLEYIFNQIFSFTVAPSGEVLVHDQGEGIRRFDAQGRYLGHLAREGEGPSEVRYVLGLSASRSATVAAYDLGNSRITLFEEDGTTRTIRRPEGMPPYGEDALIFHHDQSLWVAIAPPFPPDGPITHPRQSFVRISDSGALLDTLFTPASVGELCPILSTQQYRGGFYEDNREPYFPKAKWSLGPDGTFVVGCPADYTFDVISGEGPVVRISRPWVPLVMSEEEKDFKVKWGILPRLPSELPAYARLILPGDGRIWVWPTQPSMRMALPSEMQESFGETHTWAVSWSGVFDVFSADGEWLAVVKLPEEARYSGFPTEPSIFIRGDTLWAVAVDSLDVQYVVRYQVDGLAGAH